MGRNIASVKVAENGRVGFCLGHDLDYKDRDET